MSRLVEKLVAAESVFGEEVVAAKVGVKVQMYRLIKEGKFGLSTRRLGAVVREFPAMHADVLEYLREQVA